MTRKTKIPPPLTAAICQPISLSGEGASKIPMTDSFANQYKHPKWQKLRLLILERDNFTCTYCESKSTELHVHHLKYKKGGNLWDSNKSDLITLCKPCHERVTNIIESVRKLCWDSGWVSTLEHLLNASEGPDGWYIENILQHFSENDMVIQPIFRLLNAQIDKEDATKTSKTGAEG